MTKSRMKAINEQVILFTEASKGIGLAAARLAAERGAKVVLSSSNEEQLRAATEEIRQKGGECCFVVTDISRYEDLIHLRDEAIKNYGRIDTWVNNAGSSLSGYLLDTPLEEERKLFEINFWGTRMGCQIAIECMKETGGTIINLGSEVSLAAQPLLGAYSATKHAVKAITDSLRSELRDRNTPIEVTLIHPTTMESALTYSPDICAEAILKNAENPQRDVFVGGPAKLSAIVDTFFPKVKDMVAENRMKELKKGSGQSLHEKKVAPSAENAHNDNTTMGYIRSITQSARKSFEHFRRAG
jgi:short-subunit dehydrogenase